MTLKEIEKVIDEAEFYLIKYRNKKAFGDLNSQYNKEHEKNFIAGNIENDCMYVFFKLNDNDEVEKRWVVDHIDPEKKIIKKKLDEMTPDELTQLEVKYCCKGSPSCFDCPLNDSVNHACLTHFAFWKKEYEANKDKEFEIEVEVEE